MSAIDICNGVVTYLTGLSLSPPTGASVSVSRVTLPMVEMEDVVGVAIEVYPLNHQSLRSSRVDWERTQTIRLAVRYKPPETSNTTAHTREDQFIAFVENVQNALEDYRVFYVASIDNHNVFERDAFVETGTMLALIDVSFVSYG